MEQSQRERLVRRTGSAASKKPWFVQFCLLTGVIFIGLGLCTGLLGVLSLVREPLTGMSLASFIISLINAPGASLMVGLFFVVLGVLWYERIEFYRIIQELERRLAERETEP